MQLNLTTSSAEPCLEYELMKTTPASVIAGRPIYVAKIVNRKTVNLLALAERLAKKTPYRIEDVVHILSSLADLMHNELAQGHSINFGSLFQMTPTIHGTFEKPDEEIDPEKHRIVVKTCTGKLLRDAAGAIHTKNITPTDPPDRTTQKAPPSSTIKVEARNIISDKKQEINDWHPADTLAKRSLPYPCARDAHPT